MSRCSDRALGGWTSIGTRVMTMRARSSRARAYSRPSASLRCSWLRPGRASGSAGSRAGACRQVGGGSGARCGARRGQRARSRLVSWLGDRCLGLELFRSFQCSASQTCAVTCRPCWACCTTCTATCPRSRRCWRTARRSATCSAATARLRAPGRRDRGAPRGARRALDPGQRRPLAGATRTGRLRGRAAGADRGAAARRWTRRPVDRLAALPGSAAIDGTLYCHGSPGSDVQSFAAEPEPDATPSCSWGETAGHGWCSATRTCRFERDRPGWDPAGHPGQRRHPSDGDHASAACALVHDDGRLELRRAPYDGGRPPRPCTSAWATCARAASSGPLRSQLSSVPADCYLQRPACQLSMSSPRVDREFFDLFEEAGGNILRAAELLERDAARPTPSATTGAGHPDLRAGGRPDHARHHPAPQPDVRHPDRPGGHLRAGLGAGRRRRLHRGGRRLPRPLQDRGADGAGAARWRTCCCRPAAPDRRGDAAHARLRATSTTTRSRSTGSRTRATDSAREAIASLFEEGIDPMVVIRWKDIYERLEDGDRRDRDVAHILENIVDQERLAPGR